MIEVDPEGRIRDARLRDFDAERSLVDPVPAHVALQQQDTDARLRIEQVPGRPHAGVTAPDHDDVGVVRPIESGARSGAAGLL